MNRSIEMRNIREILRLKHENGLSNRMIAKSIGCSRDSVATVLGRAEAIGLKWPLPSDMTDKQLEGLIYPPPKQKTNRPEPDMEWIHKELHKGKHVTLMLLWLEYKKDHPEGIMYSQFCDKYRQWLKKANISMPQVHKAGEKTFVDWVGDTFDIIDIETGEIKKAYVFVAVLGASSYCYAEAFLSQDLSSWITGHVNAFNFFSGVTEIIVPDNLKTGVDKPCFYEPTINRTYQEMAAHYGMVIIPARVRKPKDKPKVESAVLNVERWIMAALRNHKFFSLTELNYVIKEKLHELNHRPFQKKDGCRYSMYVELDLPALKPLPTTDYEYAEWKKTAVHVDYHVEFDRNFYSVPYLYAGQKVDLRTTAVFVEIFHKGARIAGHPRHYGKSRTYVTNPEHVPAKHRFLMEWNPDRFVRWASEIGPHTAQLVEKILQAKPHVEQGYRACLGVIRLSKAYPRERMEKAALRALNANAISYYSLKSILDKGLDRLESQGKVREIPIRHANIRGPEYYSGERRLPYAGQSDC